jgi:hypothetical protein
MILNVYDIRAPILLNRPEPCSSDLNLNTFGVGAGVQCTRASGPWQSWLLAVQPRLSRHSIPRGRVSVLKLH